MRNKNTKSGLLSIALLGLCLVQISFATQYQYDNLNRLSQATLDDGTKIVYSYDVSGNRSQKVISPISDFDVDGDVDFDDLSTLSDQWLHFHPMPGFLTADIAPLPHGDRRVNFLDFAILAEQWLAGVEP